MSIMVDGRSKSEAVRLFKISGDTIYRWLNAEDLTPKKHSSRNRKLDKKALKKLVGGILTCFFMSVRKCLSSH